MLGQKKWWIRVPHAFSFSFLVSRVVVIVNVKNVTGSNQKTSVEVFDDELIWSTYMFVSFN